MEKLTYDEFEKIVEGYNNGTLKIGVKPDEARKMLINYDKKCLFLTLLFPILLIASFIIYCFNFGFPLGILFSIILYFTSSAYISCFVLNLKFKKEIYYICLALIPISIFFNIKICMSLLITSFTFLSIYYMYQYSNKKIIDLVINNMDLMSDLLDLQMIIIE